MNKFTKGAIATGAGIILLMGGAGTFALWNDSASVTGGSITSGTLAFDDAYNGDRNWLDISTDNITPVSNDWDDVIDAGISINPVTFLTVPGDRLVLVEGVQIESSGNNLEAEFGYTAASATLPSGVSVQTIVLDSAGDVVTGTAVVDDGDTFTVAVVFSFDSSVSGTNLQDDDFSFGDVAVTVTQVRP